MKQIPFIITLLLLILSTACAPQKSDKIPPVPKNGVLDLAGWNLETDGKVSLDGEWEFFWDTFLVENEKDPKRELRAGCTISLAETGPSNDPRCAGYRLTSQVRSLADSDGPGPIVKTPHIWEGMTDPNNQTLPGTGHAVYRLPLHNTPPNALVDIISMEPQINAARMWGKKGNIFTLLDSSGHPSDKINDRSYRKKIHLLRTELFEEIWVEVANSTYRQSRFGFLELHTANQGASALFTIHSLDFFVIGFLVMAGLYHILLFLLRRRLQSALWLGLFCLIIAIRVLIIGRYYEYYNPTLDGYDWILRLEYLTVPVAWMLFSLYTYHLFDRQIFRWWFHSQLLFGTIFTLFIFFFPVLQISENLWLIQIFYLNMLIWVIAEIVNKFITNTPKKFYLRPRARAILIVSLIFIFLTINDIVYNRGIIQTGNFLQFGLVLFLFGQSFILARENALAWANSDHLSLKLGEEVANQTAVIRQEKEKAETALAELDESQKALSIAERQASIAALAAHLAHEINNPLNYIEAGRAVVGDSSHSLRTMVAAICEDDPAAQEFYNAFLEEHNRIATSLGDIGSGSARIAEMIAEVRALSGTDGIANEEILLDKFLPPVAELFRHQWASKVPIEIYFEEGDIERFRVFCSSPILRRACLTVLAHCADRVKNAIEGAIRISLSHTGEENHPWTCIDFSCNGAAISPEEEKNLFRHVQPHGRAAEHGRAARQGLLGLPFAPEILAMAEVSLKLIDHGRDSGWITFRMGIK